MLWCGGCRRSRLALSLSRRTPGTVQDPKGHPGLNSAQRLEDWGRVGGKLTRTEAGKPQQDVLNSWKPGLKTGIISLVCSLFFVTIEAKITKSGPLSANGLGQFARWERKGSAELQQPVPAS